jgi:multiple sugar transport system permease protein
MNALGWLILIVASYGALTLWVANIMRAFKAANKGLAGLLLALPVLILLVAGALPSGARVLASVVLLLLGTAGLVKALAAGAPIKPLKETRPALLHLVLISGSALFLVPFAWMVVTSVKEDSQMSKFPPEWVPLQQVKIDRGGRKQGLVKASFDGIVKLAAVTETNTDGTLQIEALDNAAQSQKVSKADVEVVRHFDPVWKNYPDALKFLPRDANYGLVNLQNTLTIAIMSVIGTVLSSSLVAYSFSRLRWPGRDWLFGLVLATMMLPDAVTMMPRFLIFRQLHWIDTLYPLWVPSFFASAFNVFLLRQFFMGIPKELEDASRIDGCSYFGTYWRVMLPMVKPALAAVTIMTFINAWKDFMGPLIYISSPEKMPLSYVLQLFNSSHGSEPGMLMAATTLVMLPVIVLFFFTQKYFIEGVTLTGLGGR